MTASARQRSRRRAAFAKASRRFAILRSPTCDCCGGQRSFPAPLLRRAKSEVGEEAATPGQPVALARVFWSVPRQFTLENRRLPLALPQSFGKLRNSHVSLHPLSASSSRPATQKLRLVVQKLWTMRLPCGSPWKSKNEFSRPVSRARPVNNLYIVQARQLMWGRTHSSVQRRPALSEVERAKSKGRSRALRRPS
jgi:hypothetical protein